MNSTNPVAGGGFAPAGPTPVNNGFGGAPTGMNNAPMGVPVAPMGAPTMPVLNPLPANAFGQKAQEPARGGSKMGLIGMIFACVVAAVAVVFAVSSFLNYRNLENNFDAKVDQEVHAAKKAQHDEDEANYAEREKEPNKTFTGPSDFGSLSFQYPKTWSVYIDDDGSKGNSYSAYFRPDYVDSVSNKDARYALRFSIVSKQSDAVQKDYKTKVDKGDLTSSVFNQGTNMTGMRYEGQVDKDMYGEVVIIKINDKTAILQTDAEVFKDDFDKLVDSLTRNSD